MSQCFLQFAWNTAIQLNISYNTILSTGKRGKSHGAKSWRVCNDRHFVISQKVLHIHSRMKRCIPMMEKPIALNCTFHVVFTTSFPPDIVRCLVSNVSLQSVLVEQIHKAQLCECHKKQWMLSQFEWTCLAVLGVGCWAIKLRWLLFGSWVIPINLCL
jgi:hypothetical protein